MKVAIYARVSTEAQEARGTIGSQLEALRKRVADDGHQLVAEFCDDGHSGARLDRPGLDALRDQAEAGAFDAVWCLSPDRLARVYAYQVVVLEELARFGVRVLFADAPPLDDDPQARLLIQVQGVIAEYERAKIAERYRRGKLYRSRLGEIISWRVPYGYRRVSRSSDGPARLEVFEPEAAVVRRIFDDRVHGGHSTREITRRLNADGVATPTGKPVWGTSTIGRMLHNETYAGRAYFNKTETVPARPGPGRPSTRQQTRPRDEWITIACPPIISDALFDAAQRVSPDMSKWSPRNTRDEAWLLRGLVRCGSCGVGVNCHRMRGRNATVHHYYWCRNHDPLRAGGEQYRCPERNIQADALDTFVFDHVRDALLRPETLLAGQTALSAATPTPDDELLAAELARLERKLDHANDERRRLADLYQTGLLPLTDVQRRAREIDARITMLTQQRNNLIAERHQLAADNRLHRRVTDFAHRAAAGINRLDFHQRQHLLRLLVDHVTVSGARVEIHLRISLDEPLPIDGHTPRQARKPRRRRIDDEPPTQAPSSNDGLRSLRRDRHRELPAPDHQGAYATQAHRTL